MSLKSIWERQMARRWRVPKLPRAHWKLTRFNVNTESGDVAKVGSSEGIPACSVESLRTVYDWQTPPPTILDCRRCYDLYMGHVVAT